MNVQASIKPVITINKQIKLWSKDENAAALNGVLSYIDSISIQ
jgi:hypothetical protein